MSSYYHSLEADCPILVIEEGIDICINDKHLPKASFSVWVTKEEIDICVNDKHPSKT